MYGNLSIVNAEKTVTTDTCSNPTMSVTIAGQSGFKFNVTEIKVPKDTCVKFTFVNEDSLIHDFTVTGVDSMDTFQIPEVNKGVAKSIVIKTPNVDTTTDFYCSVPGHREQGMEGKLVIGSGGDDANKSSSPGFELLPAFLALFVLLAIPIMKRK